MADIDMAAPMAVLAKYERAEMERRELQRRAEKAEAALAAIRAACSPEELRWLARGYDEMLPKLRRLADAIEKSEVCGG